MFGGWLCTLLPSHELRVWALLKVGMVKIVQPAVTNLTREANGAGLGFRNPTRSGLGLGAGITHT